MIDPHRLRVFRAVVAAGSIRGAADNLGYTSSAVSQQVAALQRETGLTLITRNGRGIQPTASGHELAKIGGKILDSLDEGERRIRELGDASAKTLRLACFSSVGTAWIPSVVQTVVQQFTELKPQLILDEVSPVRVDDDYDLRLVIEEPGFLPPAGLQAELLLTEPYLAALPAGHRLAETDAVDMAELADEVWISNEPDVGWCQKNLLNACAAAGFQPDYAVEAPDHPTALEFVAMGVGITVLPELCLRNSPPQISTVTLRRPSPERSIFAVTRSGQQQPAVQLALAALRRVSGSS